MLRRIVPLVMTLTIALCPVALDVCHVACAEHEHGTVATPAAAGHDHHAKPADAMAAHPHGHHAVSETAASAASSAMRGVPHSCLHGEDLPAFVGTSLQLALAPAAMVPTLFTVADLTSSTRVIVDSASVVHSPPISLTTQLRV